MIPRVEIIDVPISAGNLQTVLHELDEHLEEAKRSYICVSNVHTTVMAHDDLEYRKIQAESFLTLPDGKPLSLEGKKYGATQMEQVRGVDLMKRLFEQRDNNHYKHFFYGNTAENLNALIKELKRSYPGIDIVGYEPSVFHELTDSEIKALARRVKNQKANFLWVGLGAPRQEKFCYRIQGMTGAIPVGVGGAFNVLARIVPDAPEWMRKCSLEWLYRFVKDPKRLFKRYFVTNIKFIYYILKSKRKRK